MSDKTSELSKVDWVVSIIKGGQEIQTNFDSYEHARGEYDARLNELDPNGITSVLLGRTDFHVEAKADLVTIASSTDRL